MSSDSTSGSTSDSYVEYSLADDSCFTSGDDDSYEVMRNYDYVISNHGQDLECYHCGVTNRESFVDTTTYRAFCTTQCHELYQLGAKDGKKNKKVSVRTKGGRGIKFYGGKKKDKGAKVPKAKKEKKPKAKKEKKPKKDKKEKKPKKGKNGSSGGSNSSGDASSSSGSTSTRGSESSNTSSGGTPSSSNESSSSSISKRQAKRNERRRIRDEKRQGQRQQVADPTSSSESNEARRLSRRTERRDRRDQERDRLREEKRRGPVVVNRPGPIVRPVVVLPPQQQSRPVVVVNERPVVVDERPVIVQERPVVILPPQQLPPPLTPGSVQPRLDEASDEELEMEVQRRGGQATVPVMTTQKRFFW